MTIADLERELRDVHEETFSWALVCCRGVRSEAEDVVQETYLKLLDGRLTFDGRSSFRTWIFAVVRRAARDRRRRTALRRVLLEQWVRPRESRPPAQEARTIKRQRARTIRRLLGRLSTRQRQVLELVLYHELPLREAATVLDISPGSASRHYDRGKRTLLARLKEAELEL
ncbi:MAG: RNA polymerase sigma factor [Acidobacteria bacterium]|nr:RNA polymerase sigma factor [Acidobacteriota bacterium]